jgi:hypothetical protein
MTWRRFKNLLRGLSSNSVWQAILADPKAQIITDPDEAERAVDKIWK